MRIIKLEPKPIAQLGHRGSQRMLEVVSYLSRSRIIRGHAHWKQAFAELPTGLRILNVDARVVVLRRKTRRRSFPRLAIEVSACPVGVFRNRHN